MSHSYRKKSLSRRAMALLVSYSVAVVAILGGFVARGYTTAARYSTRLGYTYEQGLTELSERLNNIQNNLKKGIYCGTANGAMNLALSLRDDAIAAKTCLAQVPTYGTDLENTYKFLSQVGEFSLSLARKMSTKEAITDDERSTLLSLADYSRQINGSVAELCVQMNQGGQWSEQIKNTIETNGSAEADDILAQGFEEMEGSLNDFPTLLYDGPFSDHILQASALYLEGKQEISAEEAAETLKTLTGVEPSRLTRGNDEDGLIPSYEFSCDSTDFSVTKAGRICSYLMDSRDVGEGVLSYEDCLLKAQEFLKKLNLGEFKESYYSISEGQCLINFAYTQNGIICYTDLIKIGVALDNGQIINYNAQGFIMNHRERSIAAPKYSLDEARAVLSPLLSVESENTAVIPLETREEQLCYEFVCRGDEEDELIVYVNANTLNEERLMILLRTDGGTLTI